MPGMRIRPSATAALLVAVLAGVLAAATASPAAAATPCWKRVINQWLNNQPINTHYKPQCYQQALKHVPEDLRDYSDITDAISIALQAALRGGGPASGGGTQSSGGSSGTSKENADGKPRHLQNVPDRSYYRRAIDNLGTTSADSLPIPLLVLAGLGTALLLSAAGLAAHKRLKARPRPPAG